jgi:AsmA protein
MIRRELIAQVKSATGRDLTIAGKASVTLFPKVGLRVGDVSLSAPPGMGGDPFLTARRIEVGVRLMPLIFQKEIIVDRLILYEPSFALHVDTQGRKSWAGIQSPRVRFAEAVDDRVTDAPPTRLPRANRGFSDLSLGVVRVVDGSIQYRDDRNGHSAVVEAINATAGLHSIAQPLDTQGSFVWAQEKINFDATLTSPQELMQERPAKLVVSLKGSPGTISYDGAVTLHDALSAEGARVSAPSRSPAICAPAPTQFSSMTPR